MSGINGGMMEKKGGCWRRKATLMCEEQHRGGKLMKQEGSAKGQVQQQRMSILEEEMEREMEGMKERKSECFFFLEKCNQLHIHEPQRWGTCLRESNNERRDSLLTSTLPALSFSASFPIFLPDSHCQSQRSSFLL